MEKFIELKEQYERDGVVQLFDVFNLDYAKKVGEHYYNLDDNQWNFVMMKDNEIRTFMAQEDNALDIYNARYSEQDEVDSFGYHYYRINEDDVSEEFIMLILDERFKKLIYNITGHDYDWFSYFISKYISGDYNGWHHDQGNGDLAIVYHLSPRWSPHWGGLTQYWKTTSDIPTGWNNLNRTYKCSGVTCPVFNSIVLMDVKPETNSSHFVSHIMPGLSHSRIAITGWLVKE